jgi:CheY-like chemotaxis protein
MVIDDDDQMRVLLRQVMEWAGYEVVEAEDGREGMQIQRRQPVDLVITDLIMPEQEGLETISLRWRTHRSRGLSARGPGIRGGPGVQ